MKKNTSKKISNVIHVLAIVLFLTFVFFVYRKNLTQYIIHKNTPNVIMDESTVQDNVLRAYEKTVLNPEHEATWFQQKAFSLVNYLSSSRFTSKMITYIHSRQDWVMDCSECALGGSCDDLEKEQYFYPISIDYDSLQTLQDRYENVFIIDVRPTTLWENGHIPNSVTVPLTDVVPYLFPMNRWHEIVIVGDNYLETKIAGEALIQLNFHRVYRLIQPVSNYPGELERIDGN
jgi:rhodanese-related sulfurtransferase